MDIYTIIFLALAVFIFLRLRSVLGQRTGSERPPYDRAAPNVVQRSQDNNVVPMPGSVIDQPPMAPPCGGDHAVRPLEGDRRAGHAARAGSRCHRRPGPLVRSAAFRLRRPQRLRDDRAGVCQWRPPRAEGSAVVEVYESFEAAIKDREKHEQKTETRFVSIDKAEIVSAEARDRSAQLTVRFVSQMISVTRDKAGTIVDGNPDKVADITDVWTFARDTTSRDPNWKLVGTGSAS